MYVQKVELKGQGHMLLDEHADSLSDPVLYLKSAKLKRYYVYVGKFQEEMQVTVGSSRLPKCYDPHGYKAGGRDYLGVCVGWEVDAVEAWNMALAHYQIGEF